MKKHTAGSWNTAAHWSTDPGATTPDPAVVPGAADTAIFNISSVDGYQLISLNANQAVNGLTFENTGTTTLLGGGTGAVKAMSTVLDKYYQETGICNFRSACR